MIEDTFILGIVEWSRYRWDQSHFILSYEIIIIDKLQLSIPETSDPLRGIYPSLKLGIKYLLIIYIM
jgi:hypothetical protein